MTTMTISRSKGSNELGDGRLPLAAPDSVNSKVKSTFSSQLERRSTRCCFNELLLSTSNSAPPAGKCKRL